MRSMTEGLSCSQSSKLFHGGSTKPLPYRNCGKFKPFVLDQPPLTRFAGAPLKGSLSSFYRKRIKNLPQRGKVARAKRVTDEVFYSRTNSNVPAVNSNQASPCGRGGGGADGEGQKTAHPKPTAAHAEPHTPHDQTENQPRMAFHFPTVHIFFI